MKDYGVSRYDRYQSERDSLQSLPRHRYTMSEWREAKVHPGCHIQVQHCYYSIPFRYVGQTVRVKMTDRLIEIFSLDLEMIACHKTLSRKGSRSTEDGRLPEQKLQASRFEIKQAIAKAEVIGPKMSELLEKIFSVPHPLSGLRKTQGMLRMWGKDGIDNPAMEYAAGQCLTFAKYKTDFFRHCAIAFQRNSRLTKHDAPTRNLQTVYLQQGEKK